MSCQTQAKNTNKNGKTPKSAFKRMVTYLSDYQGVFNVGRKNVFDKAISYLKSIWASRLSNLERIAETGIPDNYFQLQNFISDSPWDARMLMDQVCSQAARSFIGEKLTGLHIDESGVRKKGVKSVGVDRQYCGNIGKVDNCQVGVFAALSHGDFSTIVDSRLYLPKKWIADRKRLEEAGVPEHERVFRTKGELALDMIKHQLQNGTRFDYIGGDAYYGADQQLTDQIDAMALPFLMDIRENQHLFLEEPEIRVPEAKSSRGRKPTRRKPNLKSVEVKEYCKALGRIDFIELKVRNTAKGKLTGLYHFKEVWIWNGESAHASKRLLVIRKTPKKKKTEIRYALGNVDLVQYEPEAIAYMQAQRFFIEHSFKEAKSVLGLDQFQTRKWIAWHHQVALNMLLLLFIMKEKMINFDVMPLLSAWDIKQLMAAFISSKFLDENDVYKQVLERHKWRQKDINRYYSMC